MFIGEEMIQLTNFVGIILAVGCHKPVVEILNHRNIFNKAVVFKTSGSD